MKIASRLYAALAALALVVAGTAAVAPSSARAEPLTTEALLALAIFTTVAVATVVLVDEENDDDEAPQSP